MSPELLRMAKRAALPINVVVSPTGHEILVGRAISPKITAEARFLKSPKSATRAYFDLVESLTPNPDTSPSLVSGAGDLSASLPPRGA